MVSIDLHNSTHIHIWLNRHQQQKITITPIKPTKQKNHNIKKQKSLATNYNDDKRKTENHTIVDQQNKTKNKKQNEQHTYKLGSICCTSAT